MTGGLIQLVTTGGLDQYIIGSPEISYFKAVYKRHTNFAIQNIKQTFISAPLLTNSTTTCTCRLGRYGDLLWHIYINFRLPNIYSTDRHRFRWIQHIGEYIIQRYSIRLDSQLIDEGYGEWMDIWNELSLPAGKRSAYNDMIGNTSDMYTPIANDVYAVIQNNNVSYSYYPISADKSKPSIIGRRLLTHLPFWFSKNPALALPLVALQYQNVELTVEFRAVEDLYQLWDNINEQYVSPNQFRSLFPAEASTASINNFLSPDGNANSFLDLDAYIECNYIFLDDNERKFIATTTLDYLVERTTRVEVSGVSSQTTLDLILQNPVKELLWIARRSDVASHNDWANLTATFPENKLYPILNSAKLIWNGLDRTEEKSADFFNRVQPYQHHTNNPRQGLYSYSFALHPEKWQPSGSFNASMINRIQLFVSTNDYNDKNSPPAEYTFTIYSLYYNVFHVVSGRGGMVNAN